MNRRTKRIAFVAFVSGLLFVSGVAFAEWLTNGSGSGYAKAGNAQALTTSAVVAASTLYPGVSGDLALTVNNPNPYPVRVTSVAGAGPIVSSNPACNSAGHGVTFVNQSGLSLVVPANASASFVLAESVRMAETSANECQGAAFEIPVTLNGISGTGATAVPTCVTPVVHSNGLGGTYLDCSALGTPGNPASYTSAMALAACSSYALVHSGLCTGGVPCPSGAAAVSWTGPTTAAVWSFGGITAGRVMLNTQNNTAFCPATTANSMWN